MGSQRTMDVVAAQAFKSPANIRSKNASGACTFSPTTAGACTASDVMLRINHLVYTNLKQPRP